jgi:hypothetical protein
MAEAMRTTENSLAVPTEENSAAADLAVAVA